MLTVTVTAQLISGYREESVHSIKINALYLFANIGLWISARKKYDPPLPGYASALLDVDIYYKANSTGKRNSQTGCSV